MTAKRLRVVALLAISMVFLLAWAFPIIWSVMNSLKTDSDVLAYPPKLVFSPTLESRFGRIDPEPNRTSR